MAARVSWTRADQRRLDNAGAMIRAEIQRQDYAERISGRGKAKRCDAGLQPGEARKGDRPSRPVARPAGAPAGEAGETAREAKR